MEKSNDSGSGFVRQLIQSQNQIYSFILALVPNWSDADDILQDTAEILWRKYGQDTQIQNFTGLGIRVAQNLIYSYYRRKKRQEWLLEEKALEEVAGYAEQLSMDADNRVHLLHKCLSKLSHGDMQLIRLRYEEGLKVQKIAEACNRSADGLYKTLIRIHDAILRCVKRGLAVEKY
ncbi:MAG: sigma-70 family RNA polymerase sigma factor [Syntrophaceae bacterium]|nr:sigma-70 family RNA polymerase sigma factor [Syntrophaceae bacterium]